MRSQHLLTRHSPKRTSAAVQADIIGSASSLRPHFSCSPGIQPASASGVRTCSLLRNGSVPRARPPRYTEIQITDVYPRFHRHTHCRTPVSARTPPSLQPSLPRHPAQIHLAARTPAPAHSIRVFVSPSRARSNGPHADATRVLASLASIVSHSPSAASRPCAFRRPTLYDRQPAH